MVAPTFTESASENVGAVINCPRRKCCVYTEISGEFATCTRAISDRPYILRMAPSVNVGAAISRPRRKCCDYTEIPGELATCSRAISDRPYILRMTPSVNVGAVINRPRRKCCVYTEISGEFAIFGTGNPSPTVSPATGAPASSAIVGADAHNRPAGNVAFTRRFRRIRNLFAGDQWSPLHSQNRLRRM